MDSLQIVYALAFLFLWGIGLVYYLVEYIMDKRSRPKPVMGPHPRDYYNEVMV